MNLIIVESPLQLLCAYEIIKLHPEHSYKLLLRKNGRGLNDTHLENCIDIIGLEYESFLLRPEKLSVDLLKNLKLWLRILPKKYNEIYLGSYYSKFLNTLKKNLRFKDLYYLDDGAATLRAQLEFEKGVLEKVNWFTFFNIKPLAKQKIIQHDFKELRKLYNKPITYGSYFIGQPFERMPGLSRMDYYENLKEVSKNFTSKNPLIYIPHRLENLEMLKSIDSIKIIQPNLPLELYFLDVSSHQPTEIFGFYSTALITLKILFPDVKAHFITNPYLDSTLISSVYEYFRLNGLIELKLKYTKSCTI